MIEITLKNGQTVEIRKASKEDAQEMIFFYNKVGGETDFLSFGKDEFQVELQAYEDTIENTSTESNSIILLAWIENVLVSIATIHSSQKERTKHQGTLGIVVSEQFCGLGLGQSMMEQLIDWAKSNHLTKKITLLTREDNVRAVELYKKLGFEVEGHLKKDTIIDGQFFDTLLMSLFL